MVLTSKKYEALYATTGDGDNRVTDADIEKAEAIFDHYRAKGMDEYFRDLDFAPLMFLIQQMQDELDYLRTEISSNKGKTGISTSQANAITANTAKTSFPGLGTTNKTALAGNTTTITTTQADAITRNTAKVTFPGLGTTKDTALAGNTIIPIPTVTTGKNLEVVFDNLKIGQKTTTIDLLVVDTSTKKQYTATITLT